MYAVDATETIHIYYERETEAKPFVVLPLLCALLCILGMAACTLYSVAHPVYEHTRLLVPAVVSAPQTFTARVAVVPTGVRTYPATIAHGRLTITNGSVIAQTLPAGFIILSNSGIQVATDTAVFVPAGNANDFGRATVAAHLATPGTNLPTLAVNQVFGTSLYIRNLQPFTGGRPAYSVTFVTSQDKLIALLHARATLMNKSSGLHFPCSETIQGAYTVAWRCQFITYRLPVWYHVTSVRLIGKNLVLTVWFVPRPEHIWVK
jgi:hypothetical protein